MDVELSFKLFRTYLACSQPFVLWVSACLEISCRKVYDAKLTLITTPAG